jgi:hypothetical protein
LISQSRGLGDVYKRQTRCISASAFGTSTTFRKPNEIVTASNSASANGSAVASAKTNSISGWRLRLGPEGTDAVVRAAPIRCTHYDAFRFFTPGARPLNRLAPTLDARVDNEQPGCVHVTMDLFKWAMKAQPWVSAELAADAFELAHIARTVDMRASPYDFSAIGLKPIAIETAEGRGEYETEQRRLSALAEPVRARLIAELERALA